MKGRRRGDLVASVERVLVQTESINSLDLDLLLAELPSKWELHGEVAILPQGSCKSDFWNNNSSVLQGIAKVLRVSTLLRRTGPIRGDDDFRRPSLEVLFSPTTTTTVATKRENGIFYQWDTMRVMFSSGNISEKLRLSKVDCRGEVVLDLFAGIGYFALTFLVHCRADLVIACEWNPQALTWLERNLSLNKVDPSRYRLLEGDNLTTAPKGVADRVHLGLVPSSQRAWGVACAALKPGSGGVLHVHGNVDVDKEVGSSKAKWAEGVVESLSRHFHSLYPNQRWRVEASGRVVRVKSYGPKVDHCVVDVDCRPEM